MKWIVTADWHLGLSEKHNLDVLRGCEEIKLYSDRHKIPLRLINAGDIFHNPKPHPDNYEFFNECMKKLNPVEHITFSGNHDKNTSTDAFTAYEPDILNTLYHQIKSNSTFSPIGYESCEDFGLSVQQKYRELDVKGKILITHTDIPGAALGSEREIQLGAVGSLPVIKGLKFIISGHIHKHQSGVYGGVPYLYPGSLARVSHTEEDQPKGFVIFDDETLKWEFIERKTDRKWKTFDINWKGQVPKTVLNSTADVARIRIQADSKYRQQINTKTLLKQLPFDQSKIQVLYSTLDKQDDAVISAGNIVEYEKEWIDKNVKSHKTEVKKRLRGVLTEIESQDVQKTVHGLSLKKLTASNFQSLESVCVEFSHDDCIGILGMVNGEVTKSNGVGKSSFVELIRWILYGATRFSKAPNAIQDNKSEMLGSLFFEDSKNDLIEIHRSLDDSGKSQAFVYRGTDADELLAKGPAESNKWVITNLGLTQKAFDTIVYVGNTNVKDFISASASERLTLMQEPIDLDKYKKAEKVFKSDLKNVTTRLSELKGAVSVFEEFINETDIDKLKDDEKGITDALKTSKEKQKSLSTQKSELNQAILLFDAKERIEADITTCQSDIEATKAELKNINELKKQREPKQAELNQVNHELKEIESVMKTIDDEMTEKRNLLKLLLLLKDDSKCPVCTSTVDQKTRTQHEQTIKSLTDSGLKLKAKWSELDSERDGLSSRHSSLKDDLVRLESVDRDEKRESDDLNELNQDLKNYRKELSKINKQLKGKTTHKNQIRKQVSKLDEELEKLESEVADLQDDLATIRSEIMQYSEYTAKLKLNQAEYKNKQKESEILSICVQAVNNKGIPKFVILQLIDQLNDSISQVIQDFNFWQTVDIFMEPDLSKDSIPIYCSIENREYREYEGLSAGERVITNLVLRRAYKQVLETLRDVDYSFVILDEALDKLDHTNLNAVISYFKRQKMQSLCISHNDLKDTFTRTIFVKSDNGVSVI